jgi:UDP:flavonoid glycosyltransferase YjiC (YdhE family)
MRVLITSLPGHGHLGPLVPLAKAIRDAGCHVAVGTSESFRPMLEEHGLGFEACGPVWRESDYGRLLQQPHMLADLAKFLESDVTPRVLTDLEPIIARYKPDVIVSNDFEPNGRVVAERLGIPFALASSIPRLAHGLRLRMQSHIFRVSRRIAGLAEDRPLDYTMRWLQLCFSPPDHVCLGPNDPLPVEAVNQFAIRPQVAEFGKPFVATRVPGGPITRPSALCTFGTVFNQDPDILRTVIAAVAPRVRRLYVLLGPRIDARVLDPLQANVELLNDVELSSILPCVDFVVTHGGTATLAAVQLQGKPCLLLPLGADQIFNGAACQRRRIAAVRFHTPAAITIGAFPVQPISQASVAEAFDELIADVGYRERASQFQRSLDALPPMPFAVQLLQKLVVTRAPVRKHG